MRFDLKTPCKECPFRKSAFYLNGERAEEIANYAVKDSKTFACHKTIPEYGNSKMEQQCAGALIMAAKTESYNKMFSIAEYLRIYDPSKIDMSADVYDNPEDMKNGHSLLENLCKKD